MKKIITNKTLTTQELKNLKGGTFTEEVLYCYKAGERCGDCYASCCPGLTCSGPKPSMLSCLHDAAPGPTDDL